MNLLFFPHNESLEFTFYCVFKNFLVENRIEQKCNEFNSSCSFVVFDLNNLLSRFLTLQIKINSNYGHCPITDCVDWYFIMSTARKAT